MDIGYRQASGLLAPDLRLVSKAADVLRLREFDLFRAAWRFWFGDRPNDRLLEPVFVDYIVNQRVPLWVRHFARRVISDAEIDQLDPRSLEMTDFPRRDPLPDLGENHLAIGYVAALVLYLYVSA